MSALHYPMFDDEYPAQFQRARKIDKEPSYEEYCQLWAVFERLLTGVRKRNEPQQEVIPRIYVQMIELDENSSEYIELAQFQAFHIGLWNEMYEIMNKLLKNKYVRSRIIPLKRYTRELYNFYVNGNDEPREVQIYRDALYGMIHE